MRIEKLRSDSQKERWVEFMRLELLLLTLIADDFGGQTQKH
jgi:hypothetical protein